MIILPLRHSSIIWLACCADSFHHVEIECVEDAFHKCGHKCYHWISCSNVCGILTLCRFFILQSTARFYSIQKRNFMMWVINIWSIYDDMCNLGHGLIKFLAVEYKSHPKAKDQKYVVCILCIRSNLLIIILPLRHSSIIWLACCAYEWEDHTLDCAYCITTNT